MEDITLYDPRIGDLRTLTPLHMDLLREVATIGAGHAATALSQMTGRTILISVPMLNVARIEELPPQLADAEEPVAGVLMNIMGDLSGRTMLVFPERTAGRLAELMLGRPIQSPRGLGELEQSAVKEAGNILSGAYMNALSEFLGMILLPSPPSLAVDAAAAVISTACLQFSSDRDYVFCVESEFLMQDSSERLNGYFLLMPDFPSLQAILRAVRMA